MARLLALLLLGGLLLMPSAAGAAAPAPKLGVEAAGFAPVKKRVTVGL